MSKLFIAYGSNLNLEQMKYRCPDSTVVGSGHLENYELAFRSPGGGRGVANIEPLERSSVPVCLWKVPAADERQLDIYEGFPWLYKKVLLPVRVDAVLGLACKDDQNAILWAWAYVMVGEPRLAPPTRGYLETIIEGYHAFGFKLDALLQAAREAGARSYGLNVYNLSKLF